MKTKLFLIFVFMVLLSSTALAWWDTDCPVYRRIIFSEVNGTSLSFPFNAYTVRLNTTGKYNTSSCDHIHLLNSSDSEIPFDCSNVGINTLTHDITFMINESSIGGVTNQVFGYVYYNCSPTLAPASFDETGFWVNGNGADGNITFFTKYIAGIVDNQTGAFSSLNGTVNKTEYVYPPIWNALTGDLDWLGGTSPITQYIKCSVPSALNNTLTKSVECISNRTGNMTQNFTFYKDSPCYKTEWMTGGTKTFIKWMLNNSNSHWIGWFNKSSNKTVHITTSNGTINSDVGIPFWLVYNTSKDEVIVTWFNQTHEDNFNVDHRFVGSGQVQIFRNDTSWDLTKNVTTWQCIIPETSDNHAVMDNWGIKLDARMDNPLQFSLEAETTPSASINYCTIGNATHYAGINFSYWEEKTPTNSITDGYFEGDFYYYSSMFNDYEHYHFSVNNIHEVKLCFNKSITINQMNATIQFKGNISTVLREYYLINQTLTEDTKEIKFYNLLSDDSAGITFYTQNEIPEAIPNIFIKIYRYMISEGTYNLIAMGFTDTNGKAYIYLEPYITLYQFKILDVNENLIKTFPNTKVMSNEIYLQLEKVTFGQQINILDAIEYIWYNTSDAIIISYNDLSRSIDYGCLRVIRRTALNDTWVCDTCNFTYAGNLSCNISTISGTYFASFYTHLNPISTRATKIYDWYKVKLLPDLIGLDGVFATFLIVGTLAFAGLGTSIGVPIVMAIAGLILAVVLNFMYIGVGAIISLIIIGIIIIIKGSKGT